MEQKFSMSYIWNLYSWKQKFLCFVPPLTHKWLKCNFRNSKKYRKFNNYVLMIHSQSILLKKYSDLTDGVGHSIEWVTGSESVI